MITITIHHLQTLFLFLFLLFFKTGKMRSPLLLLAVLPGLHAFFHAPRPSVLGGTYLPIYQCNDITILQNPCVFVQYDGIFAAFATMTFYNPCTPLSSPPHPKIHCVHACS